MTATRPTKGRIEVMKKRLMRNPHRGRVGGVCAGLADYTGLSQTLFRLLFLMSLFFGGFGIWLYLIFWFAMPWHESIPISGASVSLRWQLYRIGRRVARLHRTQSSQLADRAQQAYEAIRRLSPRIDLRHSRDLEPEIARLALIDFPNLLDQIHRAGHMMIDQENDARILALRLALEEACQSLIEASRAALEPNSQDFSSPKSRLDETIQLQTRLSPLTRQLSAETSPAIRGRLEQLEDHLQQLLAVPEETLLDVSPIGAHEIRRIAFSFLPETLEAYLKIQGPMARTQLIRDQKTAEDLFLEQLNLLDQALETYTKALYEQDAKALLIQGHFLREKFSTHLEEDQLPPSKDISP